MSEQEDKARKLKEIQERLAEIQGKSSPSPSPKSKEVPKKEAVEKPKTEKTEEKPPVNKPQPKSTEPKSTEQKSTESKSPEPTPVKPTEPKKSPSLTQEEKNWRANKIKQPASDVKKESPKPEKKKNGSRKKKLSIIYTAVSLVITLSIVGYILNSYVFNSDTDEIVTSKIPEEISPEEVEEQVDEAMEELTQVTQEEEEMEEVQEEVIEEMKEEVMVVKEIKKEKVAESPPESTRRRAKAESTVIAASVPNGIIISYASNSTSEMAVKNVSTLRSKGFKAGYYYMPDKNAGSPKLYKVYVGPYPDESSAMPDFKKVVELNARAFILRMN